MENRKQEAIKELLKSSEIITDIIAQFVDPDNDNDIFVYRTKIKESIDKTIESLEKVQKYCKTVGVVEYRKTQESLHKYYESVSYNREPEYNPCEGCQVEGTNDEDFYLPGQGPCDHCSKRR